MTEYPKVRLDRHDPEIRDCLAAEYALGTLQGPARTRFERWLEQDAELARTVDRWEAHFAALNEELPPEQPPDRVWEAVQARIGEDSAPAAETDRRPGSPSLWNSLNLWRGLAAAAVLLLAVVAGLDAGSGPPAPAQMVVVSDTQSRPLWVISTPAEGRTVRVRTLRSPEMGPERVCPLWLRSGPRGETHLVGILPEERGTHTLELPRQVSGPMDRSRVAVTVEKADRMPAQRPTGKVMFEGSWIPL
jgi:anti-sigma-K factor RskA